MLKFAPTMGQIIGSMAIVFNNFGFKLYQDSNLRKKSIRDEKIDTR